MKILICHNYYQNRGGEGQAVFKEKELLESKKHRVILFSKDNQEIDNYTFIQETRLFCETVFSRSVYKKVIEIVKEEKPDIAHVHNVFPLISPSVYYALKKMNVPVVQTVHNYRFLCPNALFLNNKGEICERCKEGNFFNAVVGKCYRDNYLQTSGMAFVLCLHRKLKTFTNKIDIFISPSNFLKKKLIEGRIREEKVVVKPHFIKCGEIKPSYEFDNYAVYMGRLSREKGLFTLLRAWEGITGFTLKIMGDGAIRNELENFVIQKKIKNVEFLGFIGGPKRFGILKKAMFMIFPSEWYENFPYTIIESFACGTPVIASKIGAITELIKEGQNGSLFESGNSDDLAEKISYLHENSGKALRMGRYARKCVEEKYSAEKNYSKLMAIYKKVIG